MGKRVARNTKDGPHPGPPFFEVLTLSIVKKCTLIFNQLERLTERSIGGIPPIFHNIKKILPRLFSKNTQNFTFFPFKQKTDQPDPPFKHSLRDSTHGIT